MKTTALLEDIKEEIITFSFSNPFLPISWSKEICILGLIVSSGSGLESWNQCKSSLFMMEFFHSSIFPWTSFESQSFSARHSGYNRSLLRKVFLILVLSLKLATSGLMHLSRSTMKPSAISSSRWSLGMAKQSTRWTSSCRKVKFWMVGNVMRLVNFTPLGLFLEFWVHFLKAKSPM